MRTAQNTRFLFVRILAIKRSYAIICFLKSLNIETVEDHNQREQERGGVSVAGRDQQQKRSDGGRDQRRGAGEVLSTDQ